MLLQKEQHRQQTKNQFKLAGNCFGSRKAMIWPPKYVRLHLRRTPIMYYKAAH